MALQSILIFTIAALLIRLIGKGVWRGWLILIGSVLAVFWLQPEIPVRYADYWFPILTLFLVCLGWIITTSPDKRSIKENWPAVSILTGIPLLIGLTRLLSPAGINLSFNPPPLLQVIVVLSGCCLLIFLIALLTRKKNVFLVAFIVLILVLFLWIKIPALELVAVRWLRSLAGQSTELSRIIDISIRWLGFSYIAFRLIHIVRDRQAKRLLDVNLQEFTSYVLFFPSLAAGPIDRIQRFIKDFRGQPPDIWIDLVYSGQRLLLGLFKKFVLADSLALFALSSGNAASLKSVGWTWVVVYAYAFEIFFDFSGYTDIAIAIGRLLGIQLPENFNKPYLQANLTQFWNNWHMSLTQWFRAYFFNPLTRSLRKSYPGLSIGWVILLTQVSTMVLIGLWHGVTWNFVIWGIWHGLGLFVQNRWSEWIKPWMSKIEAHRGWSGLLKVVSVFLTFQYVALGWLWFALPEPALSIKVFAKMIGLG